MIKEYGMLFQRAIGLQTPTAGPASYIGAAKKPAIRIVSHSSMSMLREIAVIAFDVVTSVASKFWPGYGGIWESRR